MSLTRPEPVEGSPTAPRRTASGPSLSAPASLLRVLAALAVTPLLRWLVLADSVPSGQPRRAACATCGTPIGLAAPLRVLAPVGRCAGCGSRIGAPPYAVELAVLAAAAALVLAARPAVESVALVWWAACAVPLIFIDLAVHRLPDRLTYPAFAGTLGLLGLAALVPRDSAGGAAWLRALAAGLSVALAFAGSTLLFGRRSFGLGDAKLALSSMAILGWLSWEAVVLGLMVAFAGAAVVSLVLLAARRVRWSAHLPFGPFLILGTFVALALSGGLQP